ncbi:MAG: Flagellar assembly factor fliW [Pedosphaera sp.]|nr:Flagellar assembly factor fliW [Pedosphaera sp.]
MKTLAPVELEKPASVNNETRVHLPYGLLGFEQVKNFLLTANPQEEPFLWLQMLDSSKKAFLVVSPFLIMPDYQPDIPADDVELLDLSDPSDALVFNICTLRSEGRATINLKGPVIINRHTLTGKQIIPNNAAQFSLQHPLPVA